jgi:hypothetical protein
MPPARESSKNSTRDALWTSLCEALPPLPSPETTVPPLAPRAWAEAHRRIDDRPFSLDRYVPLHAPYDDDHPHQVYRKCAQVGVSEMAITKAMHALDVGARYWNVEKAGLNVAYLFPTGAALSDFSKERFSALKDESPYLAQLFANSPYDDVGFKQVGQSYLYLRGTHSKKSLKSFPADVLVLDEFDEMDPIGVAMARKRLRASMVKREIDLSTPLLPGTGIDALYAQSDGRVWETHCLHCDGWNELDFFRDVWLNDRSRDVWNVWDAEQIARAALSVRCPACQYPLDRCGPGRWRAQRPEVTTLRGYHIPALAFPSVDVQQLCHNSIATDLAKVAEFYRSDLGLPYTPAGSRIDEAMLQRCVAAPPAETTWRHTTLGVDVGSRFHYRLSSVAADGQRYVRLAGSVADWADLTRLIAQYSVRACVIDAQPELNGAMAWAATHAGKVWRAFYPNGLGADLLRTEQETDTAGRVTPGSMVVKINRTLAMDQLFDAVATTHEAWCSDALHAAEVVAHLTAPVRVLDTSRTTGQATPRWAHTAPDHLFHASVYNRIADALLPKGGGVLLLGQAAGAGWSPRS